MEMVAVERELGSGQGDIMTRTPNSNHTWSSGIVMMLPSLPGIGSDVVLTPGNFQAQRLQLSRNLRDTPGISVKKSVPHGNTDKPIVVPEALSVSSKYCYLHWHQTV